MEPKYKVLITGARGQVGSCSVDTMIQSEFFLPIAFTHLELNICDPVSVSKIFKEDFNAVINCAAYTSVDIAQTNADEAWKVNAIGPKLLAQACHQKKIPLIHFSSDYVYDNGRTDPLKESDPCNPKSIYAISKFIGEQEALYYHDQTMIIRTSWVYSKSGQNFVNTIIKLAESKKELHVVYDQIGSPTYTPDLVDAILSILKKLLSGEIGQNYYGIFNFSNAGMVSWYDFATEIVRYTGMNCKVIPVPSTHFPRPAPRPTFSVFDLNKVCKIYSIVPINWMKSLHHCLGS